MQRKVISMDGSELFAYLADELNLISQVWENHYEINRVASTTNAV